MAHEYKKLYFASVFKRQMVELARKALATNKGYK